MSDTKKQPVARIRVGSCEIPIWENVTEKGTFYGASPPKTTYKDANGEWQTANSLNGYNLIDQANASLQAQRELQKLRSAARKANQPVAEEPTEQEMTDEIPY